MKWPIRFLQQMVNLALPSGCCGCGTPLAIGEGPWCTQCALTLGMAAQKTYCPRCGLTDDNAATSADGCHRCLEQRLLTDGFTRIGEYDGLLQTLICQYKFARQQHLDRPLGVLLASSVTAQPWACELDAIVPVPVSWRSRLEYRFSPPEALARQLGRELRLAALPLLYERGKQRRQVGLTPAERRRNVEGVFRLRRGARPAGGIFCIVDDVSTTGSTVQEVARVLKDAGATRIYAAVLAKTNPERAHLLKA